MAFTLSDDHKAQEAAWPDWQAWNRGPQAIRASLTQAHVSACDPRARFVGIDAYVAAGGAVIKNLFQSDHDGYFADPTLLDRFVSVNLETAAEAVRAERWTWVEILPKLDYPDIYKFNSIQPKRQKLSGEDSEALEKLNAKLNALIEQENACDESDASDASYSRTERHGKAIPRQTLADENNDSTAISTTLRPPSA